MNWKEGWPMPDSRINRLRRRLDNLQQQQAQQDLQQLCCSSCGKWPWAMRLLGPNDKDCDECVAIRNQHGKHPLGNDAVIIVKVPPIQSGS